MPYFRCNDIGLKCAFEIISESDEELVENIKLHARVAHNWNDISDSSLKKIRKAIHEKF